MEESYDNKYRIGVYGSRNICQKVCSLTKAESSFVADMSTGYSGNLGYSMPNNWAFEQFHEYSILGSGFSFAVDKDMASGRYKGISADSKCGQDKFEDCTLHKMKLKADGYYHCDFCNYKVPSPFLQDKEILSPDDYLTVTGLMYAYSVFLADVDTYGIYFHDLWEKMHDIRSKAEYKGKYAYRGADQNCLFVPPEVDPTGVGMTMSALREPELVTSENIDSLSGVFDEVIGAVADTIMGVLFPQNLATQIALAIEDYIYEGNALTSFNSVLQAIVGETEASAFGYILQLIELGANIQDTERESKLAIGDTVIEVDYVVDNATKTLYIVFDKDLKFKTCYFK